MRQIQHGSGAVGVVLERCPKFCCYTRNMRERAGGPRCSRYVEQTSNRFEAYGAKSVTEQGSQCRSPLGGRTGLHEGGEGSPHQGAWVAGRIANIAQAQLGVVPKFGQRCCANDRWKAGIAHDPQKPRPAFRPDVAPCFQRLRKARWPLIAKMCADSGGRPGGAGVRRLPALLLLGVAALGARVRHAELQRQIGARR
jgi:hypothetical protein